MYIPNKTILQNFGLTLTDSGTGLLGESYAVYETSDKLYKLWMDRHSGFCMLDKKLAEPGPPVKAWFNLPETHEHLGYFTIQRDIDLLTILKAHVPVDEFWLAINTAFQALHEKVFADAYAGTIYGTSNIKRRTRTALNWSADVDWNLRRILALSEAGQIGPEATCWAITAAARKSPSTPAGERDTVMVDVQWSYKRQQVSMPYNPVSGHFRVLNDNTIVSVIDRRHYVK
jgi:hypothetical protein